MCEKKKIKPTLTIIRQKKFPTYFINYKIYHLHFQFFKSRKKNFVEMRLIMCQHLD